jgi:hypothetical protein
MAAQTRFYTSALVDPNELEQSVEAGTAATDFSGTWIEITYDDTTGGIVAALDEYMTSMGFSQNNDAGKLLNIRSANGTVWPLIITNHGALDVTGGVAPTTLLQFMADTAVVLSYLSSYAGLGSLTESIDTKILIPGNPSIGPTRKLRRARAIISTAPGAGESITLTLRKNGVDTSVVIVISGTALSGGDAVNEEDVDPGDRITVRVDKSGGAAAPSPAGTILSAELF